MKKIIGVKFMKKFISIILLCLCMFTLFACNNTNETKPKEDTTYIPENTFIKVTISYNKEIKKFNKGDEHFSSLESTIKQVFDNPLNLEHSRLLRTQSSDEEVNEKKEQVDWIEIVGESVKQRKFFFELDNPKKVSIAYDNSYDNVACEGYRWNDIKPLKELIQTIYS